MPPEWLDAIARRVVELLDERDPAKLGGQLTVRQVAQRCQVHPRTVQRAIRAGRLRAVRIGERGAYRIPAKAADVWLQRSTIEPTRAPDLDFAPGRSQTGSSAGRLTLPDPESG